MGDCQVVVLASIAAIVKHKAGYYQHHRQVAEEGLNYEQDI